tara:strand:- start:661 stop:3543 length:2883 start_codon:yes stop_codon:yes gene_type:complete
MSTQLILYPQDLNGYSFTNVPVINQHVSNYQFLNQPTANQDVQGPLPSSSYLYASVVANGALFNSGNWIGFATVSSGYSNQTNYPVISGGQIEIFSSATPNTNRNSICGIGQMLSNLTIGQQYTLLIDHTGYTPVNSFRIGGTGPGTQNFVGNNGTTNLFGLSPHSSGIATYHFTANATNMPLIIAYEDNINSSFKLSSVSITERAGFEPTTPTDLSDGQVICDLYEEEDIPLTLSIDNFKNAVEQTQSYSKDFNLPATKRNNKIFTHIFDVQKTIENVFDFNPYVLTKAVLKQDGLLIFEGSLRLISIKDNDGEISYSVNLFAETVALKDVLEGKTFAELNLAELDHQYNYNNIVNSWEGILDLQNPLASDSFALVPGLSNTQTNVLKYPFCDWTGNIDCTGVAPEIDRLEDAFRPWISIKYLLDNIARNAGYTFVSEFFDSDEFSKLYMDFNWGSENGPTEFTHTGSAIYHDDHGDHFAGTSATTWVWVHDGSPDDFDADTGWSLAQDKFIAQQTNTYYHLACRCSIVNESGSPATVNYIRFVRSNLSGVFGAIGTFDYFAEVTNYTIPNGQIWDYVANTIIPIPLGKSGLGADEFYIEWECNQANALRQNNLPSSTYGSKDSRINGAVYNNAEFSTSEIFNTERGKIKQWDFIKGIMTMFNLVTMPDTTNANNIIFEPYPDMFISDTSGITLSERSIKHDWTDKIDISDIELEPLQLKRFVKFKYEFDEEDYAQNQYKNAAQGFEYGSYEFDGSTAQPGTNQVSNLLGEEEIVASPFSSTIIKPIQDTFPAFIIPVIYGSSDDGLKFNAIENLPRILYNNGRIDNYLGASIDYVVPGQNGVDGGTKTEYLQFSHFNPTLPANNTSYDYNFGICPLFPGVTGSTLPVNNLYNIYHAPYYDDLYNKNTRIMKAKVNLNASDINTFDFRDKVMIKNKIYRVNTINYKPNTLSIVEFILLP